MVAVDHGTGCLAPVSRYGRYLTAPLRKTDDHPSLTGVFSSYNIETIYSILSHFQRSLTLNLASIQIKTYPLTVRRP